VVPQHRGRPEAGLLGDHVEPESRHLEQVLSPQEALPRQPGRRRRAQLGLEPAGEGPGGHVGPRGEGLDGLVLVEVGEHPVGEGRE
jgi:hypothetical protein